MLRGRVKKYSYVQEEQTCQKQWYKLEVQDPISSSKSHQKDKDIVPIFPQFG